MQPQKEIPKIKLLLLSLTLLLAGCGAGEQCYYDLGRNGDVKSARIFYPCDLADNTQSYHATTLSGGRFNSKEDMYWLVPSLVAADMVVFAISAQDNNTIGGYKAAHLSGYDLMLEENENPESPLYLRLDKLALTGYSFGGAGALNATAQLGDAIDASIAMAPGKPQGNLSNVAADTLLLVGENDGVVGPRFSYDAYDALPGSIKKALVTYKNYGHLAWVNNYTAYPAVQNVKLLLSSWFEYTLNGNAAAKQAFEQPIAAVATNKNNF